MLLVFTAFLCGTGLILGAERFSKTDFVLAEEGCISEKAEVNALFLYEETVVTASSAGTFYGGFADGDGVAVGEVCGELRRLNDLFGEPAEMLTSPVSGIFSTAVDGWENILTPSSLGQLDLPSLFDGYEAPSGAASSFVRPGDACFKVMDNKKDLHLLVDMGSMTAEGETMRLKIGGEIRTATVDAVYRCGRRGFASVRLAPFEEAYRCRSVKAEWIRAEREGVVVDSSALTKRFGKVGVYCAEKGKVSFFPVTVICSDEGSSLVEGISAGDCVLRGKS